MVMTGAGSGVMGAAQEGAGRERSFGLNIRLPFEQEANPWIADDPKLITFKYFFTRKLFLVREAHAMAYFPGGFGTADEVSRPERKGVTAGPEMDAIERELATLHARYKTQEARLTELRKHQGASVVVEADGGKEKVLPLAQVIDVYFPNAMGGPAKVWHYAKRLWEFVADEPRESNTEGGVFPAIFGTVMMVVIMSILVTPLGVLAAFYLREYAKQGPSSARCGSR